jgi:hypothetical protein
LVLKAFSSRSFLPESAGSRSFFHLLRSAGSTLAVRARDASEQVQCFVYAASAAIRPASVVKSGESFGHEKSGLRDSIAPGCAAPGDAGFASEAPSAGPRFLANVASPRVSNGEAPAASEIDRARQ